MRFVPHREKSQKKQICFSLVKVDILLTLRTNNTISTINRLITEKYSVYLGPFSQAIICWKNIDYNRGDAAY